MRADETAQNPKADRIKGAASARDTHTRARTGNTGTVRDADHHNAPTVMYKIGVLARHPVLPLGWVRQHAGAC